MTHVILANAIKIVQINVTVLTHATLANVIKIVQSSVTVLIFVLTVTVKTILKIVMNLVTVLNQTHRLYVRKIIVQECVNKANV